MRISIVEVCAVIALIINVVGLAFGYFVVAANQKMINEWRTEMATRVEGLSERLRMLEITVGNGKS